MSALAADTSQGETKTATTTEEETKTKTTPVSFYTNLLPRPENIPLSVFAKSVQLSKEGIKRNKYNHHKGNAATRPPCLHERCENWKYDQCADCGADLGPERLAKEQEREKKNIAKDHHPLVDFIAASASNLRVTHATLGQGTLHELRGTSAAIVFDCDPSARRVVLPCSDVEEFRTHLEVHHATQSHRRGIRLDALLAFAHDHDCMEWPTWIVHRDIILAATRDTMCRYADLPDVQGMFGETTVFMSHCWGGRFGDLVGAACHGARRDRVVWIDIFAVKQWPGNVCDLNFRGVIERSEAMVVSTSSVVGLSEKFLKQSKRDVFLASEQGEAAKKFMPFCRLWCVVEVAAGVARNKSIVVKCGTVVRREDGTLEYITQGGAVTMANLSYMIDVVSSECAVQADYDREMDVIRETEGGVENVNAIVSGVVSGAVTSIRSNVLEIDAAACGEVESLLELKMSSLSKGEERKRAGKMLKAACAGGRVEIVRVLLDKWLAEEEEEVVVGAEVVVEVEETKGEERREEERGGERWRRKKEEWLCRLVDEKLIVLRAAMGGHLEVVKMLLERVQGADVNVSNKRDGSTALYMACQNGDAPIVELLLAMSDIDVNRSLDDGQSPLFAAAENGHLALVTLLINAGTNLNTRVIDRSPIDSRCSGLTPLGISSRNGHENVVQLLVNAGAQ